MAYSECYCKRDVGLDWSQDECLHAVLGLIGRRADELTNRLAAQDIIRDLPQLS